MDGWTDVSGLTGCGVYALAFRGEVVYVGRSTRPFARLAEHVNGLKALRQRKAMFKTPRVKVVAFDKVYFQSCTLGELESLEMRMIKHYQPKHNTVGKPSVRISLETAGFNYSLLGIAKIEVEEEHMRRI